MSKEHTKGRLVAEKHDLEEGVYQLYVHHDETGENVTWIGETDEANAHRLVACWNACEGVSTELLKKNHGYKKTLEVLEETEKINEILWTALEDIKQGRLGNADVDLIEIATKAITEAEETGKPEKKDKLIFEPVDS